MTKLPLPVGYLYHQLREPRYSCMNLKYCVLQTNGHDKNSIRKIQCDYNTFIIFVRDGIDKLFENVTVCSLPLQIKVKIVFKNREFLQSIVSFHYFCVLFMIKVILQLLFNRILFYNIRSNKNKMCSKLNKLIKVATSFKIIQC